MVNRLIYLMIIIKVVVHYSIIYMYGCRNLLIDNVLHEVGELFLPPIPIVRHVVAPIIHPCGDVLLSLASIEYCLCFRLHVSAPPQPLAV